MTNVGASTSGSSLVPTLGDRNAGRQGFYLQRSVRGDQPLEADAYDKALVQWNRLGGNAPIFYSSTDGPLAFAGSSLEGTEWKPIGPSPITQGTNRFVNGIVAAAAVNPNNPKLIFLGSEGGGLWRTLDGGNSWSPLYDQFASLGIGEPSAVAINPQQTNTIYVGAGPASR